MLYYHVFCWGDLQVAAYQKEWKKGEAIKTAALAGFESSLGTLQPSKDRAILERGKRRWLYPKKPAGRFYRWRTRVSWALLAFLFLGPFIQIHGQPLLMTLMGSGALSVPKEGLAQTSVLIQLGREMLGSCLCLAPARCR